MRSKSNPDPVIDGWRDLLDAGGLVIGVDPGANTGLVALLVPSNLSQDQALWVGSRTVTPSTSAKFNHAQRDIDFIGRITSAVNEMIAEGEHLRHLATRPRRIVESEYLAVHAAVEEPLDATLRWTNKAGEQARSVGTMFRLGAYYATALAGLSQAGDVQSVGLVQVCSYPVTTHGNRQGWMQGAAGRVSSRERVYAAIQLQMRAMAAPHSGVSDHEMSACGVALFHLTQIQEARFRRKVAEVKARGEERP